LIAEVVPGEGNMENLRDVDCSGIVPEKVIDVSDSWKPYLVAYRIIKETGGSEKGKTLKVIVKESEAILADIKTFCEITGYVFAGYERDRSNEKKGAHLLNVYIKNGERKKNDHKMTVTLSTASLEQVVYPLDKAVSGAVLGMQVNVVFEGAAVRLLKRGYKPKLSGLIGGIFTGMVKKVMRNEIGWPQPQESIAMLEDLGAKFYVCGPSMFGYKVEREELIVKSYTIAAVVTWVKLLADSDIQIFSKAEFEKP
jgi:predicted peroxiredoxin